MNKTTAMIGMLLLTTALGIPGAPPAAAAESATVTIVEKSYNPQLYQFEPALLQIAPGTTVTWANTGTLYHTVTVKVSSSGDSFDYGIEPGKTFEYTFEEPAVVLYHCVPHEDARNGNMRGLVVVQ